MTEELKPLSKPNQRILDAYILCWNKTEAYRSAHPKATYESARTAAARLFATDNFSAHLQARLSEVHLSADEALKINTDHAHGDIGNYFKVVDEWMFDPIPMCQIIADKKMVDPNANPPSQRTMYLCRHVVLDMEKIRDPKYSKLIRKFSSNRRSGLSIELYPADAANERAMRVHGLFKDKLEVQSNLNVEGLDQSLEKIYGNRNHKG